MGKAKHYRERITKIMERQTVKCKKCGNTEIILRQKGPHIGEYCKNCGAWIRWKSKQEAEIIKNEIKQLSEAEQKQLLGSPVSENPDAASNSDIEERVKHFVDALDATIDNEYAKLQAKNSISSDELIRINTTCYALDKCRYALLNILAGNEYNQFHD